MSRLFCGKHVTLPIFQLEFMIKWSSTVQMNRSLHVGLKITLCTLECCTFKWCHLNLKLTFLYFALMCLTVVVFVNLSVCHRIAKRNRNDVSAEMMQVVFLIVCVCVCVYIIFTALLFPSLF